MIIRIKNFKFKTTIGIHSWEKNIQREMILNVEIETDFNNARTSDFIGDTIDYDKIINDIKILISQQKFNLVEKMAEEIFQLIVRNKMVKNCKLELEKLGAIDGLESFSVVLK
jgi:dihydroneopterin aldolase